DVNRTMVNLGFGREWYSSVAKDQPVHWRLGVDGGVRYGTMKVDLNELTHRTDVIGGAYLGGQLLFEYTCKNYILNLGGRTEYAYTWSDVFQRASDFGEINFLLTGGIRY